MPFDVYTAMGALVRAEAIRTTAPAPAAKQPPVGATEFGDQPVARGTDRAQRRSTTPPSGLPSALRRLAARLG